MLNKKSSHRFRFFRRQAVIRHLTVLISLLLVVTGSALPKAQAEGIGVEKIFSPDSFYYQKLPSDTPVNPLSPVYVQEIIDQLYPSEYGRNANINHIYYTPTVYKVEAGAPTKSVSWNNCMNVTGYDMSGLLEQLSAVPIPDHAMPALGTDSEMVVWQPETDTVWEMWVAEKDAQGNWSACYGGRMENASQKIGVYPDYWGVAASGLSLAGGLIRKDEVINRQIDHVLDFAIAAPRKDVFSWPANRTDGPNPDPNAIPQGLRFRLDPNLDLDSLNLTPVGKAMAKAIQEYGMIIRDTSSGPTFYAESAAPEWLATGVNPYVEWFGGESPTVLQNFPWESLQALPFDYGKPGTQPITTTTSTLASTTSSSVTTTTSTTSSTSTTTTSSSTSSTTTTVPPESTTTTTKPKKGKKPPKPPKGSARIESHGFFSSGVFSYFWKSPKSTTSRDAVRNTVREFDRLARSFLVR